jgi:hypothetical protein
MVLVEQLNVLAAAGLCYLQIISLGCANCLFGTSTNRQLDYNELLRFVAQTVKILYSFTADNA